jgi:hypothetical protein
MNEARTLERPADRGPREHEVGEHGIVTVSTTLDSVVVRGVEGTSARLIGPDAADILAEASPGRLTVRTAAAPDWPATGNGHGWLGSLLGFGFGRPGRTIELEVPRGCRVEVSTASGAVDVEGVGGGIAVTTASGDVRAGDVGGDARVRTASGSVAVGGPGRLAATIRTASGDVDVAAGSLAGLDLSTVRGRIAVAGAVEPTVDGRVSTASGRVDLALAGDVTVVLRTVSGRARATHAGAAPGDRGPGWVLGAGTARVAVSTISGGIHLHEHSTAGGWPGRAADAETGDGTAPGPGRGAAPADGLAGAGEPPAAAGRPVPPPDEATLEVLRALERGEIDVDEAARRLDAGQQGSDSDA